MAGYVSNGCAIVAGVEDLLTVDGCVSEEKIAIDTCEGSCVSKSIYSIESNNFTKQCSCCSAIETEERTADLKCPDGSKKTVTYKVAMKCGCHSSKCEDEP